MKKLSSKTQEKRGGGIQTQKKVTKSIFDDSDDSNDDLFSSTIVKPSTSKSNTTSGDKPVPKKSVNPIFGATSGTRLFSKTRGKSRSLFDDSSDSDSEEERPTRRVKESKKVIESAKMSDVIVDDASSSVPEKIIGSASKEKEDANNNNNDIEEDTSEKKMDTNSKMDLNAEDEKAPKVELETNEQEGKDSTETKSFVTKITESKSDEKVVQTENEGNKKGEHSNSAEK